MSPIVHDLQMILILNPLSEDGSGIEQRAEGCHGFMPPEVGSTQA